jgi:hypothetical protein
MKQILFKKAVWIPAISLLFLIVVIVSVRFAFLAETKAALMKGELPAQGVFGKVMSPKTGCLYFADIIEAKTFETFLNKSTDAKAKGFVISLLGWKHRTDMLDHLQKIEQTGGYRAEFAVLSAVAIEQHIPFPGKDFAGEFYSSYAEKAIALANKEGIPLREAALSVAQDLRVQQPAD